MYFTIDYSMLPPHMQEGARRYVEQGVPPGDFLYAVLCNQLRQAFERADDINTCCMKAWATWLYSACPMLAQGSAEAVKAWIAKGGLYGMTKSG